LHQIVCDRLKGFGLKGGVSEGVPLCRVDDTKKGLLIQEKKKKWACLLWTTGRLKKQPFSSKRNSGGKKKKKKGFHYDNQARVKRREKGRGTKKGCCCAKLSRTNLSQARKKKFLQGNVPSELRGGCPRRRCRRSKDDLGG